MINGKLVYLTEQEIQDYWDKEEQINKSREQARLFELTRPRDAEHQVFKREYSQKIKRLTELNKKRAKQYMNNDKRNLDVHDPFKFADFGITELDELGPIIEKKKNSIVKDLMTSLSKRYERLKKIPKELGIPFALPAPVPEQASFQTLGRKRKQMELEPKIKVPGLECNRSLPKDVPFVNNMVGVDSLVSYLVMASMIKTKNNARFSLKLRKLIADHPDQEKLKSKKVKLEALGYHWTDHSVSYLQDARPESTRKTLAFSEAVLSE
ncbi:hypothetical protein Tco_0452294 [Tanacetum coccineum]